MKVNLRARTSHSSHFVIEPSNVAPEMCQVYSDTDHDFGILVHRRPKPSEVLGQNHWRDTEHEKSN